MIFLFIKFPGKFFIKYANATCIILILFIIQSCEKDFSSIDRAQNEVSRILVYDSWELWEHSPGLSIYGITQNSREDFFVSTDGGIERSTDRGNSWERIFDIVSPHIVEINPFNDDVFINHQIIHNRVTKFSTDNGNTWELPWPLPGADVGYFVFLPTGEILAGGETHEESKGGIFRSTDNGRSWAVTNLGYWFSVTGFAINSKKEVFANLGSSVGLFVSYDTGKTWERIESNIENLNYRYLAINSEDELFLLVYNEGIFTSKDSGITWEKIAPFYGQEILVDLYDNILLVSYDSIKAGNNILFSSDSGQNWHILDLPFAVSIWSTFLDSQNYMYLGTARNGIIKSRQPLHLLLPEQ